MEAKVRENREVLLSKVCPGTLISITFTVWLNRGVRIPFFSLSFFSSIIDDPILSSSVTNTTHDGWGWACFDALPVDKTTQKHLPELVSTPFDFSKMKRQSACLRLHALQFGIRRVGSMPTRTMWRWLESLTLNNGCRLLLHDLYSSVWHWVQRVVFEMPQFKSIFYSKNKTATHLLLGSFFFFPTTMRTPTNTIQKHSWENWMLLRNVLSLRKH